jgi:6-phosphofructo-2-kinase/fructose-2,6-biphosphatase 4
MAEGNQSLSYIQIFNGGQRIVVNQLRGYLRTRTLYYLMNLRSNGRKSIFLMQSVAIEKDSALLDAFRVRFDIPVWVDTKIDIDATDFRQRATLCKLNEGDCEGLSTEQIKERYPEEYKQHCLKPYHHRYHMAESYHDLVVRLESIIMELEKSSGSILIIADVSVIRCIYAYFIGAYPFVIPSISFGDDPREIIKLEPKAYGCYETRIPPDQLDCVHSLSANFRQYVDLS